MYKKLKKLYESFFEKLKKESIAFFVTLKDKNDFKKNRKHNNYVKDLKYKKQIKEYYKRFGIKVNPMYHFQYSVTCNNKDVRFIPDYLYYTKIMDYYSDRSLALGVNDKNYYEVLFPTFRQPEAIIRFINGLFYDKDYSLIDRNNAIELCKKENKLIYKPSLENGGGYGIKFSTSESNIEEIFDSFKNNDFIVQKIVKQHPELSKYNSTSLNTIRITSLIINNKVSILGATFRMGVNDSLLDNACAGGIFVALEMDGSLHNVAYNIHGVKFDEHPNGTKFEGNKIPHFDTLLNKIIEVHEKMAHFRLISWDTTISDNGEPVLIEANLRNGGPFLHQYNYGPIFGDLTDDVLNEVFGKKE